MKKYFLLFICLLIYPISWAQEITATPVQTPQKEPFAKPFDIQYQVTHSPGYEVTLDETSLSKDFEITQSGFTNQTPQTGVYDFTVVPFTLGKSTFTVTFLLTQNGQTVAQSAQALPLEITPVKTFADKKLREVRPARVPPSWLKWFFWLFLLMALIYLIYYWRRKSYTQRLIVRIQEDNRPNDEIALSKIDALLNSGLWERKAYKLFYITLCDILREYLWRQFQTDTSADTSAELLRRVRHIPAMQPLLMPLKDFLNSGDLVKFAKAEPEESIRNKDIQILREIVRETFPKETTPLQENKKI